jgi:hypothetical protein
MCLILSPNTILKAQSGVFIHITSGYYVWLKHNLKNLFF